MTRWLLEGNNPFPLGTVRHWEQGSVVKTKEGWVSYSPESALRVGASPGETLAAAEGGAKTIPAKAKPYLAAASAAVVLGGAVAAGGRSWERSMSEIRSQGADYVAARNRVDKSADAYALASLRERGQAAQDERDAFSSEVWYSGTDYSGASAENAALATMPEDDLRQLPEYGALYETKLQEAAIASPDFATAFSEAVSSATTKGVAAAVAITLAGYVARKVLGGIIAKRKLRQQESADHSPAERAILMAKRYASAVLASFVRKYSPATVSRAMASPALRAEITAHADDLTARAVQDAASKS